MAKWIEIRKGADFQAISERFDISPMTARLIRNKEIIGEEAIREYLYGTLDDLHPAALMKGLVQAVTLLKQKTAAGKAIRIIGDYDIDGVCSTYILLRGLRALGAKVDTDIPDRMKDGYGLNQELVKRAFEAGVDTIITCDNGIAAVEEIAYAKSLGMTVIVTDHHEVQEKLPPADVIVNPRQTDCGYPFKKLCGAAVAWKLVGELWTQTGVDMTAFYDDLLLFAGFATVGDVMDLTGENRILVREGLNRLRETSHPGMLALMKANEIPRTIISAFHIGFVLGPCINASGRLATAKRALDLLDTDDEEQALWKAKKLRDLNEERKAMTEAGVKQAVEQLESCSGSLPRVLVIYLPDCHESLAGIIAGRIRERYYRPVFVLTKAEDGVKGSGRSIPSYSMFEEMGRCKELYSKYGGHPMAAGVSMPEAHVELFRNRLNELCSLTEDDLTEVTYIDMILPFAYAGERLISELSLLEPFGKSNTKPVFAARNIGILKARVLGKNQNILRLTMKDESRALVEGIYFSDHMPQVMQDLQHAKKIHILYYPEINVYRGTRSVQMRIQEFLFG